MTYCWLRLTQPAKNSSRYCKALEPFDGELFIAANMPNLGRWGNRSENIRIPGLFACSSRDCGRYPRSAQIGVGRVLAPHGVQRLMLDEIWQSATRGVQIDKP